MRRLLMSCLLALCCAPSCKQAHREDEPQASVPTVSASVATAAPPAKPSPRPPYNVLFILIDSLRADMPWTGYERPIAPWLTAFAKRATLYPRAYSLSSYTAKSVVPALVGKYPSEMKRDGYFFTKWYDDNLLVTERAQQAGHRTLSGQGHGYFLPSLGVNQGFDEYRLLPGTFLDVKGVADITSDRLNALAKEMLGDPKNTSLGDKRFFAYFHFLDPHYTYIRHPEHPDFGNGRRDLYDNEVHFTDKWVGDLVDFALGQPWGKDTAVIISADHGEGFGERGQYRHAYELWESLIRVPLFIYVPGAEPRRIEVPRGHIDLAPTIAELMGLRPEPAFRGQSLVGEVFGAEAAPRPVIADLPRCDLMDRRRAMVVGDSKLVAFGDDKSFMLFDVARDPKEERDLSAEQPEKLAEMKALYAKLSADIPIEPVVGGVPLKGVHPSQRH
ncbi:MAG: sulfatase-like hydrolase/transferase [Polyangiaceae bacterium]|nr:sulfatase-like hydrolase/transferase [Polyangiaceae bacterium]